MADEATYLYIRKEGDDGWWKIGGLTLLESASFLTTSEEDGLPLARIIEPGDGMRALDNGPGGSYIFHLETPGTLTASTDNSAGSPHTHAVSSSSNPGAVEYLLSSDSSGHLTLVQVNTDTLGDRSGGNLTISPTGDIVVNPTGNDVLPANNYDINLGSFTKKYLTLHAAELWVETLVAQDTIATIGGRILVGPTTKLTSDLSAEDTTIYVEHNEMASGDRIYMEANGQIEFMAVTSAPGGTGPYSYSVTRNLDGSGINIWYAGDAVFNTGTVGDGFIDIYSFHGVKSALEYGPTIVGNVRNSATFDDWTEHWAIGNLNGIYGYSSTVYGVGLGKYGTNTSYLTLDATNGIRFYANNAVMGQWQPGGDVTIGQVATGKANLFWDQSEGRLNFRGGTNGTAVAAYIDTDGSIKAGGGYVTMNSDGFEVAAQTDYGDDSSYKFRDSGDNVVAGLYCYANAAANQVYTKLETTAAPASYDTSLILIWSKGGSSGNGIQLDTGSSMCTFSLQDSGTAMLYGGATPDLRIAGGLYIGGVGTDPDADDIHYDGNLKSVKSSTAYDVYAFCPLATPLTNTAFDGDSFSDVGSNTKIENTSWSSTIPTAAKALLVTVQVRDSGSITTSGLYFSLYSNSSTSTYSLVSDPSGKNNDDWDYEQGIVPCDAGDIWYRCNASGTGTLEVYLRVLGYWI